MALVVLKEVDKCDASSAVQMAAFEQSRCNISQVSLNPALPDVLVLATSAGFVQLVQTAECSFRLFQLQVDGMPILSPVRCVELSPALYAAEREVHHLVLAYGYSNQLLCANADSGACTVVSHMESRPSAVFCDGDYIAAGDGCGTVELFRGTTLLKQGGTTNSLLWKRRCGHASVAALVISRNVIVAGFADYTTMVLALKNGEATASLLHEASVAAALTPVMGERLAVLTHAGSLTLFSTDDWGVTGIVSLSTAATCAAVDCVGIMVVGTSSGSVVVMSVAGPVPQELVRFDVQQPVAGIQLYDRTRTLVVVTRSGDVWRWGIDEVLSQGANSGSSAEQEDDVPPEAQPAPQGEAPKPMTSAHSTPAKNVAPAAAAPAAESDEDDDAMPRLDETEVEQVIEMFDNEQQQVRFQQARSDSHQDETAAASKRIAVAVEAAARDVQLQMDQLQMNSHGDDRRSVGVRTDDSCQPPPSSVAPMSQQRLGFDTSVATPQSNQRTAEPSHGPAGKLGGSPTSEVADYKVAIEGLREGRRMNPRVARYAVEQSHIRSQQDASGVVRSEGNDSQTAVLATRQLVAAESFDPRQYAAEHPAEAQGLRFRHPVPAVSFSRNEAVFSSVGLTNHLPSTATAGGENSTKPAKDDLVSATFDKFSRRCDEQFEQMRQRPGPNIRSHMLNDLMMPPASSCILFSEYHVKPAAPPLLMAGMPMPPTPLTY